MSTTKKGESILKHADKTTRPVDDFYKHVNGKWLAKAKIPKDKARWGTIDALREQSQKDIKVIIENLTARARLTKGSSEQRVRDLYALGMDMKRRNAEGFAPIEKLLKKVDALETAEDMVKLIAHLHTIGIGALWDVEVDLDLKDTQKYVAYMSQSGIHLPDRDYYTKKTKDMVRIQNAYKAYMTDMWQMHGLSGEEAQKATVAVYHFETKLARSMMTQVELRNIEAQYNVFSAAARGAAYKNMLWKVYCKGVGLSGKERTVITQPKYFELLDSILAKGVTAELKRYLAWCVLSSATSYTSDKAHKRAFDFYGTTLTGLERRSPLWKRSAGVVEGVLGYALGQIYVKKHFSESAKKKVKRMVEHLIAVYEKRIKDLDWMSASTKKKAIVKLHSFEALIGYPDKWRSYKGLVINPEKSYYDNLSAVATYEHRRNIKRLGKKVERKEWHMTPQTVNAYCSLDRNLIVFPAAILQPPCFDTSQDDAVNYGAIGAVIGHEMTHGYDDMGRQFDQKGNLKNWWQEKDRTQFMKKAQMLVTQFNELALHGQQVNGELTLGENIADLGGATLAYDALMETLSEKQKKAKKDGLTPQQRFFVGWARAWREVARPEFTKRQLLTDPHAPEKFRTNIPFANMTEFHEAYGVTEGDKMWLPENKRAKIW